MTIKGLQKKIQALDTGKIITDIMEDHVELLNEINKSQLYAGKTRFGIDLSPTYQEDPYFDTRGGIAAAQRYSDWKDRITPSSERRPGVPNLLINGYYYSTRETIISGEQIVYSASYKGPEIEAKYGEGIYGLGGKYKEEFLDTIEPVIQTAITTAIGLKFSK